MMMDVHQAPVTVTLPDGGKVSKALLTVRDGTVEVWALRRWWPAGETVDTLAGQDVVRVGRWTLEGEPDGRGHRLSVPTTWGTLTTVGCGCGSPFRRWQPPALQEA